MYNLSELVQAEAGSQPEFTVRVMLLDNVLLTVRSIIVIFFSILFSKKMGSAKRFTAFSYLTPGLSCCTNYLTSVDWCWMSFFGCKFVLLETESSNLTTSERSLTVATVAVRILRKPSEVL